MTRRCPRSRPRNGRSSPPAGNRRGGPRRAPRTRGRYPRSRPARSGHRSRRARRTGVAAPRGRPPSSNRPGADSRIRGGSDRRRDRSSRPSRRATRCRPLPATCHPDRRASRRPGQHPGADRTRSSNASSQPDVTIVSLLSRTRISPRARLGRAIAAGDESQVGGVALEAHAGYGGQRLARRFGRRVVDDENFVAPGRRVGVHALQAGVGEQGLAVHRHDDRNPRLVDDGEVERCDRGFLREHRARRRNVTVRARKASHDPLGQRTGAFVAQDQPRRRRHSAATGAAPTTAPGHAPRRS